MKLEAILEFTRGRMRSARALRTLHRGAWLGLYAAAALVVALALLTPVSWWWALAVVPLLALLGGLWGWARPAPSELQAALALDRHFELRETLSTALSCRGESPALDHVRRRAEERGGRLNRRTIRHLLRPELPWRRFALGLLLLLLFATLPGFLPGSSTDPRSAASAARREKERKAAQKVREAARKLEKKAKTIENAARTARLEEARRAARKIAREARKLSEGSRPPHQAIARLRSLSRELDAGALRSIRHPGSAGTTAAKGSEAREALASAFKNLDRWGAASLQEELEALSSRLAAQKGAQVPLDASTMEKLLQRLQANARQMEELSRLLAALNADPELRRLAEELAKKLAEMGDAVKGAQDADRANGSKGIDQKELERLLEALRSLDAEAMQELLRKLAEMDLGSALQAALDSACNGMCEGNSGGSRSQALMAALARLRALQARSKSPSPGEGSTEANGKGQGSSSGPQEGQASGGNRPTPEAGDTKEEKSRIQGRLDETGRIRKMPGGRGLPDPQASRLEFERVLKHAAEAAEESLGRDELPPSARPAIRRYFEGLRKPGGEKR